MNIILSIALLSIIAFTGCDKGGGGNGTKTSDSNEKQLKQNDNQDGMLNILEEQIVSLIKIDEYEGALFQITHTKDIISKINSPSKNTENFRFGKLRFLEAKCLEKTGKKKDAAGIYKEIINRPDINKSLATKAKTKLTLLQNQN